MADITMPQLGETVTEGTITRWLKNVGDQVSQDEPLFEVSTDKVDSEVPSPASGYLSKILVPEGDTVDVGVTLAVVTDEPPGEAGTDGGSSAAAPEPQRSAEAPGGPVATAVVGSDAGTGGEGPANESGDAGGSSGPGTPEPDQASVGESSTGRPSGGEPPEPEPSEAERSSSPAANAQPAQAPSDARATDESRAGVNATQVGAETAATDPTQAASKVLSPVVRRLLAEHGIDVSSLRGSGQGGRVTRADVLAYIDTHSDDCGGEDAAAAAAPADIAGGVANVSASPPRAATSPSEGSPGTSPSAAPPAFGARVLPAPAGVVAGERDEIVPFTNIRRRTAEHMVRSKATSAHTLVAMEVDFERVEAVRLARRDSFRAAEGIGLTYLPFIARAVVEAVESYPNVNASVGDDSLIVHKDLHLSVAVDLSNEGLIAPVVHNAQDKRLAVLAREIADLAARARSRRLSADDIAGGTFTITNPGPFGTYLTVPIINQPQVAILSTDGVRRRPVVVAAADGSEAIAIHSTGLLALSFDHRAIDGAYASRFLGEVREVLETWDWEQEL